MEKEMDIGGKKVRMRASAAVPRLYRLRFRRDILQDMIRLAEAYNRVTEAGKKKLPNQKSQGFDPLDLELFENVAYIMARHADPNIPDTPEEWLEEFPMFSIYTVLPGILELWGLNMEMTAESKKKLAAVAGK